MLNMCVKCVAYAFSVVDVVSRRWHDLYPRHDLFYYSTMRSFATLILFHSHSLTVSLSLSSSHSTVCFSLLICCCCRRCSAFVTFGLHTWSVWIHSYLPFARVGPWICDLNSKMCFRFYCLFPSFCWRVRLFSFSSLHSTLILSDYGLLYRLQSIMKSENKSQHSWNFLFKFV